ncbi:MAG: patatin-like phospholipase family protein, partial [Nitrospinae bacterium]|nr:patatin-like phospholipase family protein [Nitrospinota bacterium]
MEKNNSDLNSGKEQKLSTYTRFVKWLNCIHINVKGLKNIQIKIDSGGIYSSVWLYFIIWLLVAYTAKNIEPGESMWWAFLKSYGWMIVILVVASFFGTAVIVPILRAMDKWGAYVVAMLGIPLLVWIWAGSYNPWRDVAIWIFTFLLIYICNPFFSRTINYFRTTWTWPEEKAKIWKRRTIVGSWLFLTWIFTSTADFWLGTGWTYSPPLSKNVKLLDNSKQCKDRPQHKRLGIALSGGGYRAALLHAGVLAALDENCIRVTGLATVSGGSILGGAYVLGIKAEDFKDSVKEGHFNMKREIINIQNLVRLPFPANIPVIELPLLWFYSFNRLDVQTNLLDRVLFDNKKMHDLTNKSPSKVNPAPWWLAAGTDLLTGDLIGISSYGTFVRTRPIPSRDFGKGSLNKKYSEPEFYSSGNFEMKRIATIVSASGAFPEAFNSARLDLPLKSPSANKSRRLQVVDGGVTDNLGFSLLMTAHQWSQIHGKDAPDDERVDGADRWQLDMILVSDGSMPLKHQEKVDGYSEIMRSMDVVYAGSGLDVGGSNKSNSPETLWLSPQSINNNLEQFNSPENNKCELERCLLTFYSTSTLTDTFNP